MTRTLENSESPEPEGPPPLPPRGIFAFRRFAFFLSSPSSSLDHFASTIDTSGAACTQIRRILKFSLSRLFLAPGSIAAREKESNECSWNAFPEERERDRVQDVRSMFEKERIRSVDFPEGRKILSKKLRRRGGGID